LPLYL